MNINLTLNIIMFFCMYPVVFILYFSMRFTGKASGRKLFGIRYCDDWLPAEEVCQLENTFFRKLNRFLSLFMAIPFATFFTPYMSVSYTIWVLWLLASIVVFWMICAQSYNHLLKLKEERTIQTAEPEAVYYELKGAHVRCIRWHDFIVPLLITLLTAVFPLFYFHGQKQESYGFLIVLLAASNLSLYACALWTDRINVSVISSNSDINANYARATKKLWKQFWMACIWVMTIFMVLILICLLPPMYTDPLVFHIILWGSVVSCLTMMGLCIYAIKRKKGIEERYHDKIDACMNSLFDDEEKHWVGGLIYYNPNDNHSFVNTKFGVGTTVNMAKPVGKIFIAIGGLALLSLPISCIWILLEEFTPLSLAIQDNRLVARHLTEDYSISLDSIEDVTLLTELPGNIKLHGTNSSTLEKGLFRNNADGKVEEFLNPQNDVFLRIYTGETIYYMSSYSDEETLEIYHHLSGLTDNAP